MNWTDRARERLEQDGHSRFAWPSDGWAATDCQPAFTQSDVTGALASIVTWRGDFFLSQEPSRTFFEIEIEIESLEAVGASGSWFFATVIVLATLYACTWYG